MAAVSRYRFALALVVVLLFIAINVAAPLVRAHWDVSNLMFSDSNCTQWMDPGKDSTNVSWYNNGTTGYAENNTTEHTGWGTDTGTEWYFYLHVGAGYVCDQNDWGWASGPLWTNRWHVRGSTTGHNDSTYGDWSAGAAHFDERCPIFHKSHSFDEARNKVKQGFANNGHNTATEIIFVGGSKTYSCGGQDHTFTWDGDVAYLEITHDH